MKTRFASIAAVLAAATVVGISGTASASSHREAPAISNDPAADNTDLWAWHTGTGANATLHVVASYIPLEEPAGGPNFHSFSDDVLYEIHVARGDGNLDAGVTYQTKFSTTPIAKVAPDAMEMPAATPGGVPTVGGGKEFFSQLSGQKQTYTVTEVTAAGTKALVTDAPVVPPNIGPRTNAVAYQLGAGTYADFSVSATFLKDLSNGGKVWAGPRDDGFYVDLGGVFDLANLRPTTAKDTLYHYNTHTIALDIPASQIPAAVGNTMAKFANRLGVWASASRRKVKILRNDGSAQWTGPWVQVSRLGLPLINEVIIGLQDKDKFNRTHPKNDISNFAAYILNPVIVRDAEAVGIYGAGTPTIAPGTLRSNRLDIVGAINILSADFPLGATGDVLRVDLDGTAGFPNGRPIPGGTTGAADDVTDVLSSLVLTGALTGVSDGVSANDATFLSTIPYLATPWEGYGEGHTAP